MAAVCRKRRPIEERSELVLGVIFVAERRRCRDGCQKGRDRRKLDVRTARSGTHCRMAVADGEGGSGDAAAAAAACTTCTFVGAFFGGGPFILKPSIDRLDFPDDNKMST
jgi:hypothetical protein